MSALQIGLALSMQLAATLRLLEADEQAPAAAPLGGNSSDGGGCLTATMVILSLYGAACRPSLQPGRSASAAATAE